MLVACIFDWRELLNEELHDLYSRQTVCVFKFGGLINKLSKSRPFRYCGRRHTCLAFGAMLTTVLTSVLYRADKFVIVLCH
jgi:hypothetical protein